MRIFGHVEDAYTEKLLPNAIVTFRVGDTELIEYTPAKGGYFDYEIPDNAIPVDEDIMTCTIQKPGYRTHTSTYAITGGEIEVAVELVPRLINWTRVFTTAGLILAGILLMILLYVGIKYFFFGPKKYPITSFEISPARIKAGEEAEIKWETIDGDIVLLEEENVDITGTQTVKPAKTRRYHLSVKDDDETLLAREWREIKVIPPPPTIISFSATPAEINLWDSAVLEWKTTDTQNIYILSDPENKNIRIKKKNPAQATGDEDKDKKNELNGSIEVYPLETTTFTLVAENTDGVRRTESIDLVVLEAPKIISFTTSAQLVEPGESAILSWKTHRAEQVFIDGERTG